MHILKRRSYKTESGNIIYWTNDITKDRITLVFLPGLTATHILFNKQLAFFDDKFNCLVWDAPGHGESTPFELKFTMEDMAVFLHDIFELEHIEHPVLIGQSMGGYVSQMYMELYPGSAAGFISIDSCSLKRKYVTAFDIWALRRTEPLYRIYPWKALMKAGIKGCAETEYGRRLMYKMLKTWDRDWYCKVAGHGFKMLAESLDSDREFAIRCPAILICGARDQAGSAKRYNKKWAAGENLPIYWIRDAGHNSNTDRPDEVNKIIEEFVDDKLELSELFRARDVS